MTPFTAYRKLKKAFPQYEYSVVTGANSDHFTCNIYVTEGWNRLDESIFVSSSFDKKNPVAVCFSEIMEKLTAAA